MSNLNSLIIEGNLVKNPISITGKCSFIIESIRGTELNGEPIIEKYQFEIEAYSKLGATCFEVLKKGRGVRVVGRIKQGSTGEVVIVAEHVEFKPVEFKPVPKRRSHDLND